MLTCNGAAAWCCTELLEHGARIDACNAKGQTALHMAFAHNNCDFAKALLGAGCNPFIVDADGNLPLHIACLGWCQGADALIREVVRPGESYPVLEGLSLCTNDEDVAQGLSRNENEAKRVEAVIDEALVECLEPSSISKKQLTTSEIVNRKNAFGCKFHGVNLSSPGRRSQCPFN